MSRLRYPLILVLLLVASLAPATAPADSVLPGFDLFRTDPGSTFQDFSGTPIPADFFDPGSDPFTGVIRFGGRPLHSHPACPADDLSQVDTIVERKATAVLPVVPSSDTVPIEIIALSLVSVNPITVTYNGGMNPELWDVTAGLSQSQPQATGSMTIHHLNPTGGTFDSTLPVTARFVFTRQSDNAVRVLDLGNIPFVIQFQAQNVPWIHVVPSTGSCTSNFCVNPDQLTVEQAMLAQHGVISVCPQDPTPARSSTWGTIKALYR